MKGSHECLYSAAANCDLISPNLFFIMFLVYIPELYAGTDHSNFEQWLNPGSIRQQTPPALWQNWVRTQTCDNFSTNANTSNRYKYQYNPIQSILRINLLKSMAPTHVWLWDLHFASWWGVHRGAQRSSKVFWTVPWSGDVWRSSHVLIGNGGTG